MPAAVSMKDVIQELNGLAGRFPYIEINGPSGRFHAVTWLRSTGGRRGDQVKIAAVDESADQALLRAYQKLFEIPVGHWLESTNTGIQWVFDSQSEGWNMRGQG